jgi:hypothetical protein
MAAGLGFKTFTSGEVLTAADTNGYLMQGINVFANASARTAAITSPQEGQYSFLKDTNALEYYDGAAWVGAPVGDITAVTAGKGLTGGGSSGDVTVSLATTAKGDLVAGSGASTAAVLTVGSNGETLVADSSTSTGLRYQGNFTAGKNVLINGAMAVAQRGTSATISSNGYNTVDRFVCITGSSQTWSQDTAQVPTGFRYALKMLANTSITAGSMQFQQVVESNNAFQLAGQNVTLSTYAYASTSTAVAIGVQYNTTADAAYNAGGWVAATNVSGGSGTATTTWSRITGTWTIPSTAKTVLIQVYNNATVTNTNFLSFTGVQLELGNVATAFQTATGTIQGELAACQRYYWRASGAATSNVLSTMGTAYNTSGVIMSWQNPVPMRVKASSIDYSALELADFVNAGVGVTSASADGNSTPSNSMSVIGVSGTPLTQYRNYAVRSSSSSGYVGFSAEL